MNFSIHLYLDVQSGTSIASFYDMQADPFSVGDEITVMVDDIPPVEFSKLGDKEAKELGKRNLEYRQRFHRKKVKLVRKLFYFRTDDHNMHFLTIEYYCRFV